MRELTVKDVFAVTRMLSKVKLPEATGDARSYGISIFQAILGQAEGDIGAWLADLQGITREQFDDMPARAILDVIDELSRRDDIRDFFERVGKMLSGQNLTPFKSDTAGQTKKSSA